MLRSSGGGRTAGEGAGEGSVVEDDEERGEGGGRLTWQEHLPSSSSSVHAPSCIPLSRFPCGVRRTSHSLVGESTSGYSDPFLVHIGADRLALALTTATNLLATP